MAVKQIKKTVYPWGRVSPERRIEELEEQISRLEAQIPVIEDQARETVRGIRMRINVGRGQIDVARSFAAQELRRINKNLAYQLQAYGVEMIHDVETSDDQEGLRLFLESLLEKKRSAVR